MIKKRFALALLALCLTGCVKGPFTRSHWLTFDGIAIILTLLFLTGLTLALMRPSKD